MVVGKRKKRASESKRVVVIQCGKGDDIQVSVSCGREGDHGVELGGSLGAVLVKAGLEWVLDEKKDEIVVKGVSQDDIKRGTNHDRAAPPLCARRNQITSTAIFTSHFNRAPVLNSGHGR